MREAHGALGFTTDFRDRTDKEIVCLSAGSRCVKRARKPPVTEGACFCHPLSPIRVIRAIRGKSFVVMTLVTPSILNAAAALRGGS